MSDSLTSSCCSDCSVMKKSSSSVSSGDCEEGWSKSLVSSSGSVSKVSGLAARGGVTVGFTIGKEDRGLDLLCGLKILLCCVVWESERVGLLTTAMLCKVALGEEVVIALRAMGDAEPEVLVEVVQHVALSLWSGVTARCRAGDLCIRLHGCPPKAVLRQVVRVFRRALQLQDGTNLIVNGRGKHANGRHDGGVWVEQK